MQEAAMAAYVSVANMTNAVARLNDRVAVFKLSDEGGDTEFAAGWNAFVEGRFPREHDSPEFYEGWRRAYSEYNDGKWPDLVNRPEAQQDDLG
jgi:hypothetical protein